MLAVGIKVTTFPCSSAGQASLKRGVTLEKEEQRNKNIPGFIVFFDFPVEGCPP